MRNHRRFPANLTGGNFNNIAISTTSAQSTVITSNIPVWAGGPASILITPTVNCFVRYGVNPTAVNTGDDQYLLANRTYAVDVMAGGQFAFITASGSGFVSIRADNSGSPSLSINSPTVGEGAGTIGFTVTLSVASLGTCTVDYVSASGSATVGTDITAGTSPLNGTLTFTPGQTSKTITHNVFDDAFVEGTESYTVTLSNPVNCTLGTSVGTGTITDNDVAATVSTVSAATGIEGTNLVHTVTMSSSAGATVAISLSGGTATGGGTDYTSSLTNGSFSNGVTISGGNITVPNGVSSFTVTVSTVDDGVVETRETYNLTVGGVTGVGTITDNDYPKTFTLNLSSPTGLTLGTTSSTGTINSSSLITPSFTTSKTSIVQNQMVFFDASATVAPAYTSIPWHELHYRYVVSDGSSAAWGYGVQPGVRAKNTMFGATAAYCFEIPGTHTVTLYVTNPGTGDVAISTTTITVAAVSSYYSGTATVAVANGAAPVAGLDGVPAGARVFGGVTTMAAAMDYLTGNNQQLLLKHDDAFPLDATYNMTRTGCQVGKYGSGAAPVLAMTTNGTNYGLNYAGSSALDLVIRDVYFDGVVNPSAATEYTKRAVQVNSNTGSMIDGYVTMLRVETRYVSEALSAGAMRYLGVVDCNFHDFNGGQGNVGIWNTEGDYSAILGSLISNAWEIEHNVRMQGQSKVVISNCNGTQAGLSTSNGGLGNDKQIFAIRGSGNGFAWTGRWVEHCIISECILDGGPHGSGAAMQFAPESGGHDERLRDCLVEANVWTGDIGLCLTTEVSNRLTVRNCLFGATSPGLYSGGAIEIRANNTVGVPIPDGAYLYNNSIYTEDPNDWSAISITKYAGAPTYPTNIFIKNNLVYAPNATADGSNTGSAPTLVLTSAPGANYTLDSNSSNAQIKGTAPGFTIPPTSTLTTWKPTSGYGIGSGVSVPVLDDFFHANRAGNKLGAVNP